MITEAEFSLDVDDVEIEIGRDYHLTLHGMSAEVHFWTEHGERHFEISDWRTGKDRRSVSSNSAGSFQAVVAAALDAYGKTDKHFIQWVWREIHARYPQPRERNEHAMEQREFI